MNFAEAPVEPLTASDCHGVLKNDIIASCSKSFLSLLSGDTSNVVSMSILDFSPQYQPNGETSAQLFNIRLKAASNGLPQSFEWRFLKEDGSCINSIFNLQRQTKHQDTQHFVFQVRALDDSNTAKETIRESKLLLQQMLDNSTAVVYVKDFQGRFQFVNHQFGKMFGVDEKNIVGQSSFDIFPKHIAQMFLENDRKVFISKRPMEFEENVEFNGESHTYSSVKFPLYDINNEVYAVCGISTDITVKKKTDDAFKSVALGISGSSYDNVFDSIVYHLAETLDIELAFIARHLPDNSVETLSIYNREKIIPNISYSLEGTPCDGVVGKDYLFIPRDIQQLYPGDGMLCELNLEAYAGFPLFDSKGNQQGLISIGSENPLTETNIIRSVMEIFSVRASAEIERMEADEAKRISDESYRSIFAATEDAIFVHDLETGLIIDVNPKACSNFGLSKPALINTDFTSLDINTTTPDDKLVKISMEKARQGEPQKLEWRRNNKLGDNNWDEVYIKRATIAGVERILTITRDITEKKRSEDALRKSEDRLRATFEATLDAIISMDEKGDIVEFNPAAERCFGYTRTQAVGAQLAELIIPERFRKAHQHGLNQFISTGSGNNIGKRIEVTAQRANGSEFLAELAIDVSQGTDGQIFIGYLRDITEQKNAEESKSRLEAQLRQAQKMEAIGHLTGGIAHDFNNILTSIMGNIVLAEDLGKRYNDPKLNKYLTRANRSGEKARNLIQQMLTFSRGQRGEPRALSLGPLVKESIKLLEASLSSSVEIETSISENASQIMIDPTHLEQILVNLCINARDALAGSGCISISVKQHDCIECNCESCKQAFTGNYVELAVKDNGSGISPDVLERMFEPFYSTKEVGKGSGMGLSTVHGIVHEYDGHIKVTTTNSGSCISILFKSLDQTKHHLTESTNLENTEIEKSEKIAGHVLLVDDESDVLEFMQDLLENWGLRVSAYSNGKTALDAFIHQNDKFSLIITDHTMPKMTGVQLASEISSIDPSTPIILYTGYQEDLPKSGLESIGIRHVLNKPIDIKQTKDLIKLLHT